MPHSNARPDAREDSTSNAMVGIFFAERLETSVLPSRLFMFRWLKLYFTLSKIQPCAAIRLQSSSVGPNPCAAINHELPVEKEIQGSTSENSLSLRDRYG
jgi:hypothetical protein